MAKIIVDHRESKDIIKEIIKEEIEVEVKQLDIADFIIQTKDLNNNIQNVGIERKTIQDLLNSIIDKRLINQIILLKENFDIPLVIIEGEENIYQIRDFHPNSIRGIIATIAIDFQIPIISTKNYRDTVKYLALIANRLEKIRRPLTIIPKRKPMTNREKQQYLIESLPGVGPTIAKSLLKNFKNIKEIINASEEELQKVEKIGKKKSKELKDLFERSFHLEE
jgi:Fanconi anemia group M protein